MKYVIVIPDGCADDPQESLGGKTPLQAAKLPNMDRLAAMGCVGQANNVPKPLTPASDVATLSLFGYDPLEVYTGRAPLEAVAIGVKLGPNDWAIRCNLVHIRDGAMNDFTAGHIESTDGAPLLASMNAEIRKHSQFDRYEFVPGVQYRNLLVYRGDGAPAPFSTETKTQAPHDIPDQPIERYLPSGPGSDVLRELMELSRGVFLDHPVNQNRHAAGKKQATRIWLWGLGKAPQVRPFTEQYGPKGAIISGVDLVRGTGMLIGWDRIDAPGSTGYLDTDYASKGRTAIAALADHDLVCVHIEAPDEASHEGRTDEKILALERIDELIVGPLLEYLPTVGNWRMFISPDHRTTLQTRAHAYGMVPFVAGGTGISTDSASSYDEVTAAASGLVFERGWQAMGWLLRTENQ
ncbi:MAG: cofactor-independent phosphoglycerate mutase [Zavarzinella sp.]